MTNEEAVKMLKAKLKCLIQDVSGVYDDCNRKLCNECCLNYEQGNMGQQAEYLRMSIEALEQEPCEDCISRQVVMNALCDGCELFKNGEQTCHSKCEEYHFLATLPSVTPQPKIGHWIKEWNIDHFEQVCSECGCGEHFKSNYCPNCGAKMAESEVKV
jgi:hypothetical protein